MAENGSGAWLIKALIALAFVAAGVGLLLPYLVDSPPYPEGTPDGRPSLVERLGGR